MITLKLRSKLRVVFATCAFWICTAAVAQSTGPAAFVTNYGGDSVSSFAVDSTGGLTLVDTFSVGDAPQTISVTPDGQFLAVAHGTVSSTVEELRILSVNSDATLSLAGIYTVPDSPLNVRWLSNSILAVTETDFSNSFARTFEFDPAGATLTVVDQEVSGGFNTQLESTRNNSLLFANNTLGTDSIYSYAVDAAGQMTPIENEITDPIFAVDIGASRDGNFLYGAGGISGDGNRILGFSIDAAGALSPLPAVSYTSPGESPKVIAITEDDSILLAGHGTDATVQSFFRDQATGDLTWTGNFHDVGDQGDLGDMTIMGDMLFVTDEDVGLQTLRINSDGSFTPLSPVVPSGGSRPEYIAAWPGLASALLCDFDLDADCDIDDLNLLLGEGPIAGSVAVTPGTNDQFDLNGDGQIDLADLDSWLALAGTENGFGSPYKPGDANLDGFVDTSDFNLWNSGKFTSTTDWNLGDFNGDGVVDASDFNIWNGSKFTSSDSVTAVPEPGGLAMIWFGLLLMSCRFGCWHR